MMRDGREVSGRSLGAVLERADLIAHPLLFHSLFSYYSSHLHRAASVIGFRYSGLLVRLCVLVLMIGPPIRRRRGPSVSLFSLSHRTCRLPTTRRRPH